MKMPLLLKLKVTVINFRYLLTLHDVIIYYLTITLLYVNYWFYSVSTNILIAHCLGFRATYINPSHVGLSMALHA